MPARKNSKKVAKAIYGPMRVHPEMLDDGSQPITRRKRAGKKPGSGPNKRKK